MHAYIWWSHAAVWNFAWTQITLGISSENSRCKFPKMPSLHIIYYHLSCDCKFIKLISILSLAAAYSLSLTNSSFVNTNVNSHHNFDKRVRWQFGDTRSRPHLEKEAAKEVQHNLCVIFFMFRPFIKLREFTLRNIFFRLLAHYNGVVWEVVVRGVPLARIPSLHCHSPPPSVLRISFISHILFNSHTPR